ncbi:MAG: Spy/CpxP family protein refolding chaperone [Syntrophales bacterium]
MKRTIMILSALFLLTQGTATAARAGRDRIERGMMGYGKNYDCSSIIANANLKLTVEQAARLRVLDDKYRQEIEPLRGQLSDKGRELKAEWLKTEPDRARIELLTGDVAKLQARLRAALAAQRADALTVLTPEQKAQVPDDGPGRRFTRPAGFGRQ